VTSLLYLGCPAPERADTEKPLGSVDVAVVWAGNAALALDELLSQNAVAHGRARPETVGSKYV